jgi:hypothetical protein
MCVVGFGLLVLLIGLIFRCLAAFIAVLGLGFNVKERLFVTVAWLPKATVQVNENLNFNSV